MKQSYRHVPLVWYISERRGFHVKMDVSVSLVCVEGATINESSFIWTPVCLWGIKWLMWNVNEVSRKWPGLGLRQWLRRTSIFFLFFLSSLYQHRRNGYHVLTTWGWARSHSCEVNTCMHCAKEEAELTLSRCPELRPVSSSDGP